MFWREKERENNENSGPPCGQVRVLIVGDSGVGKTSLVHLIMKGSSIARPTQTIGCMVGLKHTTNGTSGSSSKSIKGDTQRDFFIELWDVSGHERYKDCRSLFYSQINGVMFVHDLSQRRTKASLQKWAAEIAATGSFSAPLASGGPGGLPVPFIVIGNKADIATKENTRGSSGNLVDAARQWVEKQGLLSSSEELPLTESFPGSGGLLAAAKEARYDKEALMKFFQMLIRRRYFSDDLPGTSPWSSSIHRPLGQSSEILSDEDQQNKNSSLIGDLYKYDVLPPLPAQHNLTPPPTLYPQKPISTPDNYNIPRFALTGYQDISSSRSKRTDINRNVPWLSVPQFGDWDQKGSLPDYSMDFSKIREMRKQNKRDTSRASLGNEEELMPSTTRNSNAAHSDHFRDHHNYHRNHSPTGRRSIFSYFNCFVKA
ncbi:putative GTP-binding protein [Abeliophyllum distichum]|uniref:GTP-binding protein n=1 Tax=Abeliophyllum distichum TaxID=126358 RepID=A0ABD1V2C3_9LAMI